MKVRKVVDTLSCMIDRDDLDFDCLKRLAKEHGDKPIVMELNRECSDHEYKTWDLVVYEDSEEDDEE